VALQIIRCRFWFVGYYPLSGLIYFDVNFRTVTEYIVKKILGNVIRYKLSNLINCTKKQTNGVSTQNKLVSLLKRNTTAVAEMRRNCWSAVQETVLNQLHRSLSVRSCPELDNLVDHLTQPGGKSTKHYIG